MLMTHAISFQTKNGIENIENWVIPQKNDQQFLSHHLKCSKHILGNTQTRSPKQHFIAKWLSWRAPTRQGCR